MKLLGFTFQRSLEGSVFKRVLPILNPDRSISDLVFQTLVSILDLVSSSDFKFGYNPDMNQYSG